MHDYLEVLLAGVNIGRLYGNSDRVSFSYDDDYRDTADPTPLSRSMPITGATHPNRVVAPFLWGLLPDNSGVLERWGRHFQVSANNLLGLLEHVGDDLPGAVQIVDPARHADSQTAGIEWLTTADVEDELRTTREDHTAWIPRGHLRRWSLAGAQPKTALLYQDGRWGRPSGRTPTNRILKPSIAGLDDHDINEHICLAAASHLGLRAARSHIMTFGAERAIVVERYDRYVDSAGTLQRIHQEDLCQALSYLPGQKYQAEGGPSASRIIKSLRDEIAYAHAEMAIDAFVGALALNWLIAGSDAHAKNYSLLLNGSNTRLAPLYDVASALPYGDYEPKLELAMKIGDDYRLSHIGPSAWDRFADTCALERERVQQIVVSLADRAPAAFAAAAAGLGARIAPPAERLVELVSDRARRCRSQWDA